MTEDKEDKAFDIQKLLNDPFEAGDIEWRVQQSGLSGVGSKPWAMVIPYVTNRAIQKRLDDAFGWAGWENIFRETVGKKGDGYLCGIRAKTDDGWITKWDGSEYTEIEPLKGALSGAMKRAAVQFGIGRYLYNLEEVFATCVSVGARRDVQAGWNFMQIKIPKTNSKEPAAWKTPTLPEWALPTVKAHELLLCIKESTNTEDLKKAFGTAFMYAKSFGRGQLQQSFKVAYDAKKAELQEKATLLNEEYYSEVSEWLTLKVDNELMPSPNASTSNVALKLITQKLETAIENKGINKEGAEKLRNYLKSAKSKKSELLKTKKR